jgi:hypothetical protein
MSMFDKKKKTDVVDSGPGEASPIAAAAPAASAPAAQPAAPVPAPEPPLSFGINKMIELMRLLPTDNIELVVKVVKTTLESTNVNLPAIIKDATRKQGEIAGRIDVLKKEIADHEAEIATRKREIAALEADQAETSMVKDRLILAEKLAAGKQGAKPAAELQGAKAAGKA